ncbi:hypothetical protein DCAR_0104280 [Daucus carota subsp. sativus]|uniref:Uncharacterized protein n=1 Tax=Daucus carota subsp. sativus TaxID=79200 RepID=A0AAF1AJN9_DAUCS|nr:hypothetical protein DCAR_0104280 [Daucus carota subsp. sativus]
MSISPSLSPRQCPDRYAFRAGRNLPDKEFRYLRTVIVTAAVLRGFGRRLPCHQVTNFLDLPALGRRQPPWSYDFAENCVFARLFFCRNYYLSCLFYVKQRFINHCFAFFFNHIFYSFYILY